MDFNMSILTFEEMNKSIAKDLMHTENNVSIISAFCKIDALEFLDKQIGDKQDISKRLLVRFRLDDILSKATDLEIYEYCKKNNWSLYVQFNLHAKVYVIDQNICYMGSANTTSKGLSINKRGNLEMSKRFELDTEEQIQIEEVFSEALLMNDDLFTKMKMQINSINYKLPIRNEWNEEIIAKNINSYNVLFQDDFPINALPTEMLDDEIFLDIYKDDSIEVIKEKFYNTKIVQWLINILEKEENNEIYFGELSVKIHNVIFQEPKQYRKDVKVLQIKLYNWIEKLNYDNLKIDSPNHSQRIRLIKVK